MIETKFSGREIIQKPTCPFCGMIIEKPMELTTRMPGEMPVGTCSCGAVYACDETGHNIGSAMLDALFFACNMDSDLALNILPEDDYVEKVVENYDYKTHLVIPGGFFETRKISGVLFFIRLYDDIQEVTAEGVRKRLEKAAELPAKPRLNNNRKKPLSKKEVEKLVQEFDVDPILSVALEDRKIIKNLQRLLYSGDDLLRNRAAEILGRVSAVIAEADPGAISRLLQRLFTSTTDTAAFTWGAYEAIGEIISHKPDMFAGYIPQLYQFLIDESRQVQVIRTLGRIAKSNPELIRKITFHFIPLLSDPDPIVRGHAVWILGNLEAFEAREDINNLIDDSNEINLYEDGKLEKKTVGQLASEAFKKL